MHIRVIENKLTLHMIQRSCDVPVGLPQNLIQYAALALTIAHVTGTEAYEYVHSFSDAHIYVDQVDSVKIMLAREPRRLPTLALSPAALAKTDIFDFRREDFTLSDYDPHPGIKKIPVAI
jgi:thymidylate synthase